MLHFFKLLFLLIPIDQEVVLNWFGITSEDKERFIFNRKEDAILNVFSDGSSNPSSNALVETTRLISEGVWDKLQSGLTLGDVENILFFILFLRFVFLAIKYNLKTSLCITCITCAAAYLWYRHLIDLLIFYKNVLLRLPFLHKLGMSTVQLQIVGQQNVKADLMLGENVQWYRPGKLLYYTFIRGIVEVDPVTGTKSYIDPLSMLISNLNEPLRSTIFPYYYKLYNKVIPQIFSMCTRFLTQLSGVGAYSIITRVGKKYCPYLVRWHWTFLLIISFFERVFMSMTNRIIYFQSVILIPQLVEVQKFQQIPTGFEEDYRLNMEVNPDILLQVNLLNGILIGAVFIHLSFILFGLLHAICGQYFYFPFFVENAELHIGPRPKNSVYSGGYTSWQDYKKENTLRKYPRLWYGWLGKESEWKPIQAIFFYLKKVISRRLKNLMK